MAHYQGAVQSRRRWVRRVIIGLNIVVATALVVAVAAVGYALIWYGSIDKLGLGLGHKSASKPMNILLVGSDSRDDLPASERKSFGGSVGRHSDSIMLVRLDPDKKTVKVISFNRDLWLPVDGGGNERINTAFAKGKSTTDGARALINTVENNFDVEIDHFIAIDFNGFKSIVDAMGGVPIYFDYPARDKAYEAGNSGSGFSVGSGCVNLAGETALAYARSRHYQILTPTGWHADPSGDYGRVTRQQDFMKRLATQAVKKGGNSPVTAERLVRKGIKYIKIDDGFGVGDLISLARTYRGLDPANIEELGFLPGRGGRTAAGASVIFPDFEAAKAKLAPFRGVDNTSTTGGSSSSSVKPADIRVYVKNGSGVAGQAAKAELALKAKGYVTTGNSSADSFSFTKTVINYTPNSLAKAKLLQSQLVNGAVLQEKSGVSGDIELVTGSNYQGLKSSSGTSTTVSSGSTGSTVTTINANGAPSKRSC